MLYPPIGSKPENLWGVFLRRGQIPKEGLPPNAEELGYLDVTAKSARGFWKRFVAPSWRLVNDWKRGRISKEEYAERYFDKFLAMHDLIAGKVQARGLATGQSVVFYCYCPIGDFCHAELLIDWLIGQYPGIFRRG